MRSRSRWAAVTFLILAGCSSGKPVEVPADGVLHVTTDQSRISVYLPPLIRGQSAEMADGSYTFGGERSPLHTVAAIVQARPIDPGQRAAYEREMQGKTDAQILDAYLEVMEPAEKASPGRPSNVLRSYEHVGSARPVHAAQGIVCSERALVAEDRQVPGQGGQPFLFHARYYTCIDPKTHVPVELDWSERCAAAGDQLSPEYGNEAAAFFESMRFK